MLQHHVSSFSFEAHLLQSVGTGWTGSPVSDRSGSAWYRSWICWIESSWNIWHCVMRNHSGIFLSEFTFKSTPYIWPNSSLGFRVKRPMSCSLRVLQRPFSVLFLESVGHRSSQKLEISWDACGWGFGMTSTKTTKARSSYPISAGASLLAPSLQMASDG